MDLLTTLSRYEATLFSWVPFFVVVPIYLCIIFGGSYLLKRNAQPLNVQRFLAAHNLFLCILSIIMAIGSTYEAVLAISTHGFENTYCSGQGTGRPDIFFTGRIWFWGLVFYLSKYYELLDTVFIVLKRRPLTFLHVYHHIVVIALCLMFMRLRMCTSLQGIITNATVHSFMYYYYWQQSRGTSVWWKKYLTKAQIVQFFLDFFAFLPYGFMCTEFSSLRVPVVRVWWFSQLVLISFILLFSRFYQRTYKGSEGFDDKKHRLSFPDLHSKTE
jgi:hypothetical protein